MSRTLRLRVRNIEIPGSAVVHEGGVADRRINRPLKRLNQMIGCANASMVLKSDCHSLRQDSCMFTMATVWHSLRLNSTRLGNSCAQNPPLMCRRDLRSQFMSRPRLYDEERRSTAVRLPPALHNRLRSEAAARQVSANLLVERAISEYLDRLLPVDHLVSTR